MITKEKKTIKSIPVICCYDDAVKYQPVLIMTHGFSKSKESFEEKGTILKFAQAGFYVIAMDNRLHGERAQGDEDNCFYNEKGELNLIKTRKAIKGTAEDISKIIDTLKDNEQVDNERIAALGISMGGFALYSAVVEDKRISAAVPIIASPYWDDIPGDLPVVSYKSTVEELAVYSKTFQPAGFINSFHPTAMLMLVGESDSHYSVEKVKQFYKSLTALYGEDCGKLMLKSYKWTGHICTNEMMDSAFRWLCDRMLGI
ncbi:MAG: alpha/beta fold hydrolase [Oscillospiraceae bacterium]|jgi:hypothetical protein